MSTADSCYGTVHTPMYMVSKQYVYVVCNMRVWPKFYEYENGPILAVKVFLNHVITTTPEHPLQNSDQSDFCLPQLPKMDGLSKCLTSVVLFSMEN